MVSIVSIVVTFSTWLTLSRIFLSPLIVAAIYAKLWHIACFIFIFAGVTDYFDGYFARLYHQESELGRILDPVADKVLMFSTILALYSVSGQSLLPSWFILLMIVKDFVLVAGSCILLAQRKHSLIIPSLLSKIVTATFMVFVVYLMLIHSGILPIDYMSLCIQFFTICTILILLDYSYKFCKYIVASII